MIGNVTPDQKEKKKSVTCPVFILRDLATDGAQNVIEEANICTEIVKTLPKE